MIEYESQLDGSRFVLSENGPDEFADRLVARLVGREMKNEDGKPTVVGGLGVSPEYAEKVAARYRGATRV
jgi:hypothetical protein